MKKIIILSIMFSLSAFAAEEEGTGAPSNSTTEAISYQLVCTPITTDVSTNNDQAEPQNCALVAIQAEEI